MDLLIFFFGGGGGVGGFGAGFRGLWYLNSSRLQKCTLVSK